MKWSSETSGAASGAVHTACRERSRTLLVVLAACVAWAAGCDGDGGAATDAVDAVDTLAETTQDTVATVATDSVEGDVAEPLVVGPTACCLSMAGGRLVWAEAGDIWLHEVDTGLTERVVSHAATQKDPVLDGDRLVWADDRDGTFDLWTMTLSERVARALVTQPGDQDQPSLHDGRVVFIGRDRPPHDATTAEVYLMAVDEPASLRALTTDDKEQAHPHIHGDRVVWSDFRNSLSGVYVDLALPESNNSDIYGWDLTRDEELIVSTDPSKQLRPVIEGDVVAWLDWRGINPEPKYSEFQVFGGRLGDAERRLAWSRWSRPELWQRPAIEDGVIAWIAEPEVVGSTVRTGVYAVTIDGEAEPWLVGEASGILEAIAVEDGRAAWIGAGQLGVGALRPQTRAR